MGIDYSHGLQGIHLLQRLGDQVIALRLQTLAAVYGFEAYVPPAQTRQSGAALLLEEVRRALAGSDLFLAVVTQAPAPAAVAEVEYARGQNRLIIPIVGPFVDRNFLQAFPQAFYIDPSAPGKVETDILAFLQKSHTEKTNRNLLVGLSAVAVGLLLLSATSE
jgi:hypothetical protein